MQTTQKKLSRFFSIFSSLDVHVFTTYLSLSSKEKNPYILIIEKCS